MTTMRKIKVRLSENRSFYIHNDIDGAAFYFKNKIEEKIKIDNREGIGIDMMACLLMLAFAMEAKVNFFGYKLISDWKERSPTLEKLRVLGKHLGFDVDQDSRPYKSVVELKNFRDTLAHGKPKEIAIDIEIITTHEELNKRFDLSPEWHSFLKEDFVFNAYEDVDRIWNELLTRSGFEVFDTLTQGDGTTSFIEEVKE